MAISYTYYDTSDWFATGNSNNVTGISWSAGDVIVVASYVSDGNYPDILAPTNANLTFTNRQLTQASSNATGARIDTAVAGSSQTSQTIAVNATSGNYDGLGGAVWVISGADIYGLSNGFANKNGGATSLPVIPGSMVCYLMSDWNASATARTGTSNTGTLTEQYDDDDPTNSIARIWTGDWTDTGDGTFAFGLTSFSGLEYSQVAIAIRPAPNELVTDDFNRGSLGSNWSAPSGLQIPVISGNQMTFPTNATNYGAYWNAGPTLDADCWIEADMTSGTSSNSSVDLALRFNTSTFSGYYARWTSSGDSVRIFRATGGAPTQIGTTASGITGNGTLRFEAVGSRLMAYWNGVEVVSTTDTTYTAAQPPLIAGYHGDNTTDTVDNFSAGDWVAPGVPTGTGAATDDQDTASGTATFTSSATGAATDDQDTASGSATFTSSATGAATDDQDTASGSGTFTSSATGAATDDQDTASGSATATAPPPSSGIGGSGFLPSATGRATFLATWTGVAIFHSLDAETTNYGNETHSFSGGGFSTVDTSVYPDFALHSKADGTVSQYMDNYVPTDVTFLLYVPPTIATGQYGLFSNGGNTNGQSGVLHSVNNGETVELGIQYNWSTTSEYDTVEITERGWMCVGFQFEDNTGDMAIWVNGTERTTLTRTGTLAVGTGDPDIGGEAVDDIPGWGGNGTFVIDGSGIRIANFVYDNATNTNDPYTGNGDSFYTDFYDAFAYDLTDVRDTASGTGLTTSTSTGTGTPTDTADTAAGAATLTSTGRSADHTVASDDFNRADGSPGSNWTEWTDAVYSGTGAISSNQLLLTGFYESLGAYWNAGTFEADCWIEADVNLGSGADCGYFPILRGQGTDGVSNSYYFGWSWENGGNYAIYRVLGTGTDTILASVTGVGTTGTRKIRGEAVGSTLRLIVDSVEVLRTTDSNITGAGYLGPTVYTGNIANVTIDNFLAGDFQVSDTTDTVSGTGTFSAGNFSNGSGTPTDQPDTAASSAITHPWLVGNLTATTFSDTRIDLAWDANAYAVAYQIERNGSIIETNHIGLTYQDTGLNAETLYSYRVRAVIG